MKEYTPDRIRNVALIGHGGAGKTSLSEAMLFSAGATTRLGKVEEGNTLSDFHTDETTRQISINTSLLFCEWKSTKINILDTPGYLDFTGEVKEALRVADVAVVVLKAVEGSEVGTDIVSRYTSEYGCGMICVVNKTDQENADFERVVEQVRDQLSHDIVPVQFPLKAGLGFDTIIDVIRMKAIVYKAGGNGKFTEQEIPAAAKAQADAMRQQLVEAVAETDEGLLNTYLEAGGLGEEELRRGLKAGIGGRKIFPLFCISSTQNVGVTGLLDFIVDECPAPGEMGEVTAAGPGNGHILSVQQDPAGTPTMFVFKTMSESHVGELSFFRVYSGTVAPGQDLVNNTNGKPERLA